MEIYVQSRGFEQDYDYRWLHISNQGQEVENPPISLVIDLNDSKAISVVLERLQNEKLFLLITGIKASRRDIWNRWIRISIAWLGQDADEPVLRMLAARALGEKEQSTLTEKIDSAVTFDGEHGFKVSFQDIARLASLDGTEELGNESPDEKRKIGRDSAVMKNSLAEELKKCRLPKQEGLLVVVTRIQEKDVLEAVGVWRGLSSLVDTEGWQQTPHSLLSRFISFFKGIFSSIVTNIQAGINH